MNLGDASALAQSNPDKRVPRRARTKLPAKIVFGSMEYVLDCTIRDLSTGGARIAVSAVDMLPADLILIEPQNMLAFDSSVRWRRKTLIGLSFNKVISLDDPTNPETQVLRMYALSARLAWGY